MDRPTNLFHGVEILAAVSGNNHHAFFSCRCFLQAWILKNGVPGCGFQQSVNHGVTGDDDVFGTEIFNTQVLQRTFSRCKVQGSNLADDLPISFLWERRVNITGTQPGLKVDNLYPSVESRHRSSHGGGSIPLGNDDIWFYLRNNVIKPSQSAGYQLIETLSRL